MENANPAGINIEDIMQEIRREAKALRYAEPVSFEEVEIPLTVEASGQGERFDLRALQDEVNAVNASWNIPYGHVIEGNPVKQILARIARKLFKPTGAPMTQAISAHNAQVTNTLNMIMQYIQENAQKEKEQEKRILELEAELKRLKAAQGKKA